ncbi:DUF5985 family protein [Sphingomonas hankyongi]|uniref:DUF5985 family protein n=1 Tax=Sphingomonas hankyongi TaxID=2908209 RepID=A0ABT0S309_9SPHN|nr:DUF5985 family protein [Sphingomonas hankyongi]MCL6729920.1 DUF5985 family protein [Sphingomonas hankyongi]
MEVTAYSFLSGAVVFGFFVGSLLFVRAWRRTHDQLFVAFALAFGLLGVGQALLALANIPTEERGSIFVLRLAAFGLILLAVLRKNRQPSS